MTKTKYIYQQNADLIYNLFQNAKKLCPEIKFKVIESSEGDLIYKGSDIEKMILEMDGIDGDFGVNCYNDDYDFIGWFFITPYESEDCVICDYTDNEFCNKCCEEKGYVDRRID